MSTHHSSELYARHYDPSILENGMPELRLTLRGRLTAAFGIAGLICAGYGFTKALGESINESTTCFASDETVVIEPGDTVWEEVAVPLSHEYDMTIDEAMIKIHEANPTVVSLGDINAWESVVVPVCE